MLTTAPMSSRNRTHAGNCSRAPPIGKFSMSCRRNPGMPTLNFFLRLPPRGSPALSSTSSNASLGSATLSSAAAGRSWSGAVLRGRPATRLIADSLPKSQASNIFTGTTPIHGPRYSAADSCDLCVPNARSGVISIAMNEQQVRPAKILDAEPYLVSQVPTVVRCFPSASEAPQ